MLRILALVYYASAFLCVNTPWCILLVLTPIVLRRPPNTHPGPR
jgi:hypothetical protein